MKCPICKKEMEKDILTMLYPYYCSQCNGYWSEESVIEYNKRQTNTNLKKSLAG